MGQTQEAQDSPSPACQPWAGPLGPGTGGRRKPGRVGTYLARPRPNSEKDLPEHRKCWPGGLGWTGPSGARKRVHSSGCRAEQPPSAGPQVAGSEAAARSQEAPPTQTGLQSRPSCCRFSPRPRGRGVQAPRPTGSPPPGLEDTASREGVPVEEATQGPPALPQAHEANPELRTLPPPWGLAAPFPTWALTLQPSRPPTHQCLQGALCMAERAILKGPASPRSLGCTSGLKTPPGTPVPGAQRVTAGAAGGRIPHQTPTRYPRTPLTTPPPTCEHSLPRAARARMLRAELGPPPLQLDGLQSPHLIVGEAKAVVQDGTQGQLPPGQLRLPGGISRTTPRPQGLSS